MRARLLAALDALGSPGAIAIAVFLSSAGLHFFGVLPAERSLESKKQLAVQVTRNALPQRVSGNGEREIERLYALFPPAEKLTDELERVHRFAIMARLKIMKADYRLERHDAALGAFRVSLPVHGGYVNLRRFLDRLLKEMPAASIDALRFERKSAGDPQLDGQIQLTLYFRPAKAEEH